MVEHGCVITVWTILPIKVNWYIRTFVHVHRLSNLTVSD